jgi:RNA polymerase II C-terminal domain phosphatase-like 1/2
VFERDVLLGHVDVFLPPGTPSSSGLFPSNEIRISRRSPASDRCPPLAVLQVISACSMRCKLRENTLDLRPRSPLLAGLHSTCWNLRMVGIHLLSP